MRRVVHDSCPATLQAHSCRREVMTETQWALVGALAGRLLAGAMSLAGVQLAVGAERRRYQAARRDDHKSYLLEQRRLVYSTFISLALEIERRTDPGSDSDTAPLTRSESAELQARLIEAQGQMMMLG